MASFPTSVKSFASRSNGQTIDAAHVGDLQDEVNALEDGYLNATARLNSSHSTVAALSVTGGSTFTGAATFAATSVHNAGISLATNGHIQFPAVQNAAADANTLDDYEEGTWTPVLTFATPGNLSVAYTNQEGTYTKIGRQVTLQFKIITSTFTHTTASGALTITGAPFASATTEPAAAMHFQGITKASYTQFGLRFTGAGSSTLDGVASGSGQSRTNINAADMPTGGIVQLIGTLVYFV